MLLLEPSIAQAIALVFITISLIIWANFNRWETLMILLVVYVLLADPEGYYQTLSLSSQLPLFYPWKNC